MNYQGKEEFGEKMSLEHNQVGEVLNKHLWDLLHEVHMALEGDIAPPIIMGARSQQESATKTVEWLRELRSESEAHKRYKIRQLE